MHQNMQCSDSVLDAVVSRVASMENKIEYLINRQHIVDVYRRYTRGLNRYDIELLASAFWPDAQINYGFHSRGRDEWISRWQQERYLKGLSCQAHHITNETVEIDGDMAHVESYLIALWRPPTDENPGLILAGRYIDRLDRRDGEWRITVREFIPHFWSEVTSIFSSTFTTASWPLTESAMGTRDGGDPSYTRPLNRRPPPDRV